MLQPKKTKYRISQKGSMKGNAQRGWLPRGAIRKPNWKIENNVEYIGILNEGHSRQAPANFIQQEIKKAIRTQKI